MRRSTLLASVTFAAALSPALAQATPRDPAAFSDAAAAYQALSGGDAAAAAAAAQRAVAADPDNLDWRLLLVDALLAAKQPNEALAAVQPVAGQWDHRIQTRRAEAAKQTGDLAQAAKAYAIAAPLAPEPEQRAYLARSEIQALVQLGRRDEARAALRQAYASGILPGATSLDFAYAAVAAGDDQLAVQGFTTVDQATPLTGAQALDAAYAARRDGQDRPAAVWLERGARTLPPGELTPQRRYEIGRELQSLEQRVGGSVSVLIGPTSSAAAIVPAGGETTTQAGGEVWTRLGGDHNGRPILVFVRAYQTLDADTGPVGADSTQGWVGVRWKPLTGANLVVEASRMVALGGKARDDTMLRAAWSGDIGGDLRFDRDAWLSAHAYIDAARLLEARQDVALLDASIGWTWVTTQSRRDLVTAGLGARMDYDSARAHETELAAGPRLAWRHRMGDGEFRTPNRYLDLSVGHYSPIGASKRSEGLVVALTFSF